MKLELTIPESLADITLRDYQRFYNEIEGVEDDMIVFVKMVSIFCGIDERLVDKIPIVAFNETVKDIKKVLESSSTFIPRFKLNGIEYGFVPKLDSLQVSEYVDADKYIGHQDQLHRATAVLYRPITTKVSKGMYLIEDYKGSDELCDIMLDCRMDVIAGWQVFFWTLGEELSTHILSSLEVVETKRITQPKKTSLINGAGTNRSTLLHKETF